MVRRVRKARRVPMARLVPMVLTARPARRAPMVRRVHLARRVRKVRRVLCVLLKYGLELTAPVKQPILEQIVEVRDEPDIRVETSNTGRVDARFLQYDNERRAI